MGSFFIAFFLGIVLLAAWVYDQIRVPDYYKPYISKDGTGTRKIPTTESIIAWNSSVVDFSLCSEVSTKMATSVEYRRQKIKEFNDLMATLPGGEGLRIRFRSDICVDNVGKKILMLVELAHHGKTLWECRERMYSVEFVQALTERPSNETIIAFYKWLEEEMIKNGRSDARILVEYCTGPDGGRFPACMYWQEGTRVFGQSRVW